MRPIIRDVAGKPAEECFLETLDLYSRDPCLFLPEDVRSIILKHGPMTKFVLLGTNDFAASLIIALAGIAIPVSVVDDFKCHRGQQFSGINIISTDRLLAVAKSDSAVVAVNCCRYDNSKRFFDGFCHFHDIPCVNYEQAVRILDLNARLDFRIADWSETIASRADEFTVLAKRMNDPFSSETLFRVLTFHLSCDPEWYLNVARPYSTLYFRSGLLTFSEKEKFVDCGASIGESTTALIGTTRGEFDHSWMIEPDSINIRTLQQLLRKYANTRLSGKITLHPYAVGADFAEAHFHHVGGHGGAVAPIADASVGKVEIRPVDAIVDDVPTFIKMDIEGFELPALKGAVKSIQAGKPKLAISAYHRADDLIDLTNYVLSLNPDYRVGLRHHTEDRWDTCLYFY